ncbi:hypothetical protein GPUN_1645 [Glaciecola punicea ACAM 611]|uniref:Uncharacterized protein n=1 Tax=Glaciecola punicea ACAM 611 TaxID=1121923 RepID=H5TBT5_9ALTE|nr:hypothetical protein GPUN_1645 [Glaciecola punicea ACAM 611]
MSTHYNNAKGVISQICVICEMRKIATELTLQFIAPVH